MDRGLSLRGRKSMSMSLGSGISGLPSGSYSSLDSPITSVFNLASTLTGRPLSPQGGVSGSTGTSPNTSALSAPKNTGSGSGSGGAVLVEVIS